MHIVIFTGGEAPEADLTREYFSFRKADYVIAADSGLLTFGLYSNRMPDFFKSQPDAIIGDMDSLADKNASQELKKYPQEVIQTFIEDKDYTDTELALEKAHSLLSSGDKSGSSWISLVGAGGGARADHFLGVFDLFSTSLRPDAWLCGQQTFWFAPQKSLFKISGLSLRDMISISRTSASRTGGKLHSEGLLWEYNSFRPEGMPSISNRISPAFFEDKKPVSIEVRSGQFVLILPTHAQVRRN